MKTNLFLLVFLVLFVGCKPIAGKILKVTKPKAETEQSVAKYLAQWDCRYIQNLFTLKDSTCFYSLMATIGMPGRMVVFNNKGQCLADTSNGCMGKEEIIMKALQAGRDYPVEAEPMLSAYLSLVKPYGTARIDDPSKFDFTVLVFWGVYFGNVNKDPFNLAGMLMDRKDLNLQFIFLNIDIQESWGMKSKVKVSFS